VLLHGGVASLRCLVDFRADSAGQIAFGVVDAFVFFQQALSCLPNVLSECHCSMSGFSISLAWLTLSMLQLLCRLRDMCLREVGFYDIYRKIKVYTVYIAIILSFSSPLLALDSTWVFLAGSSYQSYYREM
jgi:ABC-type antimicrobial peptide transport system permease subunit